MKKLLTLAIVLASTSAFASRARVSSMGNAAHLEDNQTVYSNPSRIMGLSNQVSIETGAKDTTLATPDAGAEAMVINSMGDAKYYFSLGHDDASITSLREKSTAVTPKIMQNPFEIGYAMKMNEMNVGAALTYSNFNDKKAEIKDSTMGIRLGANTESWDAALGLVLTDKFEDAANKDEYKGKSNITLEGGYWLNPELYIALGYGSYAADVTDNSTVSQEIKGTELAVGVINTLKKDGNEFFYGATLVSTSEEESIGKTKDTVLSLPLVIGVEADAASWLTLRGSVTQTVLINDSKSETNSVTSAEKAPGDNTTAVAVGAGLKLNKITLDGTLEASTGGAAEQKINTTNLLAQVGLTYNF